MASANVRIERSEIRDLRFAEHLEALRRETARRSRRGRDPDSRRPGSRGFARAVRALDVVELQRRRACARADGRRSACRHERPFSAHAMIPSQRCRLGLVGGAFPRERLGENARADRAETCVRARAIGDTRRMASAMAPMSPCGTRKPVSPIAHGLANARRVRCDDGRRARGGFEIGDAPALLWRCEDQRPRATKQRELFRLVIRPRNRTRSPRSSECASASSVGPVVAGTGDLEPRVRARHSAKARITRCTPLYFLSRPR